MENLIGSIGPLVLLLVVLEGLSKILGFKGSPAKKMAGWVFGLFGAVIRGLIQGAWQGLFGKPKKKTPARHRYRNYRDDDDDGE